MDSARRNFRDLRTALAKGSIRPSQLADLALAQSNGNLSRNTYLWQDEKWTRVEADRAEAMPRGEGGPFGDGRSAFWGLPVSVKDCFDLAGSPTSCGVRFYRYLNGTATRDSWLVARLRAAGAVITGKTHLHPLAYGITGELAGYRATLGRGDWDGGAHLAQSFDTMGCLFRDLRDAPYLAALFATEAAPPHQLTRFAVVDDSFLGDCEPEIVDSLRTTIQMLESLDLQASRIDMSWWAEAFEIFAPIQAWEAARIHTGHFDSIAPSIRERLEWGARIDDSEIRSLRQRHSAFRDKMDAVLATHQLILLPATPVSRLTAGTDHSQTRARLLRYTTPFSLAGVPVVTLPCAAGGMQLAAARGHDEALLQLAARIGATT